MHSTSVDSAHTRRRTKIPAKSAPACCARRYAPRPKKGGSQAQTPSPMSLLFASRPSLLANRRRPAAS
eukprot:869684-Prymnesium_polylepis.1